MLPRREIFACVLRLGEFPFDHKAAIVMMNKQMKMADGTIMILYLVECDAATS
jgi:hypothetical protein